MPAQETAARDISPQAAQSPRGASGSCEPDWEIVSSPNPAAKKNYLNGVAALSDTDVWAVGYRSESTSTQTLVQHWNGQSWTTVPSPNRDGAFANQLYAVSAVSANDVWAVGNTFKGSGPGTYVRETLTMHWDGTEWSIVDSPNPSSYQNYLLDVVALAANDVWAVGYYNAPNERTLAMHWDGTDWKVATTPSDPNRNYYLASITAISPTDMWAVGSYATSSNNYQALTLHWDGTAWSQIASYVGTGNRYYLFEIDASASNDVWAVGAESLDVNDYESRALLLHWDGAQWQRRGTPAPSWTVGNYDRLLGVVAHSATDVWVIGERGEGTQTLVEHWNGASWTVYPSPNVPNTYNYLRAIDAAPGGDMWAVGYYTADTVNDVDRTLTMRYPGSDCAYPTPTVTPTATPAPSCGPVWSVVDSPSQGVLYGVDIISPSDIWAVGEYASSTLTQHWNGSQWTVVSSPNPDQFANRLRAVSAVSSNDVWAVGIDRTDVAAGTWPDDSLIIHWNGSAWEHVCCPNAGPLEDVLALASNDVWAVGHSVNSGFKTRTFIQHWNGTAWSIVDSPNVEENDNYLTGVVARS
ncbi:MAG TPA: hypothetical protein VEY08_01175, partial [Chloroflexia bacterium]|nr:hypothetical protein [Chloroflexia bacterium]